MKIVFQGERNDQLVLNAADRVKKIRSEQFSINPEFQGNEDNYVFFVCLFAFKITVIELMISYCLLGKHMVLS